MTHVTRSAICCWTFCWYTHAAPGEPYEDLGRAMRETVARGFNALRICAMPSYVSRAIRSGRDELTIAPLGRGITDQLRWYDFRGGVTIRPVERLLELGRLAREHGVSLILSSWDFNQAFKFEPPGELYQRLSAMQSADEAFDHLAGVFGDELTLLEEHGLLDVIAAVELTNELEGMEIGPIPRLGAASTEPGPKGTLPSARQRVHEACREPIERAASRLRERFPSLDFTVNTVWPWADSPAPRNLDVISVNAYITDTPVMDTYRELFANGDLWQGAVLDAKVKHLLLEGAPPYAAWRAACPSRVGDVYYPQCYLSLFADPRKFYEYFEGVWSPVQRAARDQVATWLAQVREIARPLGKPWYLGEGYANTVSLTSLWDAGDSSRAFHAWVVNAACEAGASGLTPSTLAAPEHPDLWRHADWLRAVNARITA
jgi:hypothetical protein